MSTESMALDVRTQAIGATATDHAGALFGLVAGTLTVSVASTMTAACAFLIARYGARRKVADLAGRSSRFCAIDQAVETGGWRIVALLRLYNAFTLRLILEHRDGNEFNQVAGGALTYATQDAAPQKEALDTGKRPEITWLDYDWRLNRKENAR